MTDFPNVQRLGEVSDRWQLIVDFVGWLKDSRGVGLAETCAGCDQVHAAPCSVEEYLADFFSLDLGALEAERREILSQVTR